MSRPSWDEYFMSIARIASIRGTCNRKQVGCVLVGPHRSVIATGYNGSMPGAEHCDDVGHDMEHSHCVRAVHAEVNAVIAAARGGQTTMDTTAYTTAYPCWQCFKVLVTAGVSRIVYDEAYRPDLRVELATARGMGVVLQPLK